MKPRLHTLGLATMLAGILASPASAAFVSLPSSGAQVNDDAANSIDTKQDAGLVDVSKGVKQQASSPGSVGWRSMRGADYFAVAVPLGHAIGRIRASSPAAVTAGRGILYSSTRRSGSRVHVWSTAVTPRRAPRRRGSRLRVRSVREAARKRSAKRRRRWRRARGRSSAGSVKAREIRARRKEEGCATPTAVAKRAARGAANAGPYYRAWCV